MSNNHEENKPYIGSLRSIFFFFYCGCETGWICVCKVFVYCIGYACNNVIDCAPSKTIAAACLTSDSTRRRTLPAKQRPSLAVQAALVVVGQHVKLVCGELIQKSFDFFTSLTNQIAAFDFCIQNLYSYYCNYFFHLVLL